MTVGRSTSPKHQLGATAENAAARFLQAQGYGIVAQNFNSPYGEIDVIAVKDQLLLFVEVRHRKAKAQVSAAESVTLAKQRKIIRTAEFFLQQVQASSYQHFNMRFDVITSSLSTASQRKLEWIEGAFYAA